MSSFEDVGGSEERYANPWFRFDGSLRIHRQFLFLVF